MLFRSEDAALRHTEQWRHPLGWLRQTGQAAAGEAVSQSLFGLLGGALFQAPGRQAGERVGLVLARSVVADHLIGDHRKDHRIEDKRHQ